MVERFHRQLKAAQPQPTAWMDTLPLILLGIRTALKEDISATTAEMVYGTTLCLPGENFFLLHQLLLHQLTLSLSARSLRIYQPAQNTLSESTTNTYPFHQ